MKYQPNIGGTINFRGQSLKQVEKVLEKHVDSKVKEAMAKYGRSSK